jgi:hypothetical protein
MKQEVIEFFQNLPEGKHEQFNRAFELYRKSEGKSEVVERAVNAGGFSERSLENLLYDLQKLHEITDVEKISGIEVVALKVAIDEIEEEKELLQADNEELEHEKNALEEENEELRNEVANLKNVAVIDAKSVRVEFPFLNDADCPNELKILVADKITAWNAYLAAHYQLLKHEQGEAVLTDVEFAEVSKVAVQAFDENQKIYDELNAYQTTGKLLGLHPIFKQLQLSREVEEMTAEELVNYKSSSSKYFSVNKTQLEKAVKAKDLEKVELITNRVAEREVKLSLVNKKLGISTK